MLSPSIVAIDKNSHEQLEHGTIAFPIACYYDDLSQQQVPWHWHEELEAAIVSEGSILLKFASEEMQVSAGNGFFINTGVLHGCHALTPQCRLHSMVFHSRLISGSPESVFNQKYIAPITTNKCFSGILLSKQVEWEAAVLRLLEGGWQACVKEPRHFELKVRFAVSNAVADIAAHINAMPVKASPKSLRDSERIKGMLQFIADNYGEKLSIADIARSVSVSESECVRCFRVTIGTTPIKYLREYRIGQASSYLIEGRATIADIASLCGFQDVSYFTKSFREMNGCTPKEYQRRHNT